VSEHSVQFLSKLLHEERIRRGTRPPWVRVVRVRVEVEVRSRPVTVAMNRREMS
jgi:hypothetical protein